MLTTLYSFYNSELEYTFTVYYDESYNITVLIKDRFNHYVDDPGEQSEYVIANDPITSICSGTTKVNFLKQIYSPYAYTTYDYNSPFCGYVPPSCDLAIATIDVQNETTPDNNDGMANIHATSSYDIVSYAISGAFSDSNNTGIFTGLPPGSYDVLVTDSHGCTIPGSFVIAPFDEDKIDLKYILEFTAVQSGLPCKVEFHNKKNLYDPDVYPLSLTGSANPVKRKTTNSNEDKTESICPSSIDMEILLNGVFTVEEFALSDERTWYIKYYIGSVLKFQGWILPDEVQDYYKDPNYTIALTATDGLLSLKGVDYSDETGIQEYGVFKWAELVKNCLGKLDYDYGDSTIISSLCFNNTFDNQLWLKISTWADLFYDDDGLPKDTYSVLDILLRGVGLTLFQHNGSFKFVSWNDMFYIQNSIKQTEWYKAIWKFNQDFTTLTNGDTSLLPNVAAVGYLQQLKPVNPDQSLNYDKAYSILVADIDFTYFTLLYTNPSFEIGAVENELPYYWKNAGVAFGTLHQDPSAYTGDWVFNVTSYNEPELNGFGIPTGYFTTANFVDQISPGFIVDQGNKTVNLSFVWRPVYYSPDEQVVPAFIVIFIRDSDSKVFIYDTSGIFSAGVKNVWTEPTSGSPFDLQLIIVPNNLQWNNYTLNTTELPGTGKIFIRLYGGLRVTLDGELILPQTAAYHTIQFDQFELTLGDATDAYNKQIGEKHTVTNLTNFAKAEKKTVDVGLFTFPVNKRIAGNVFYGTDYSGTVANTWNFRLTNPLVIDRLPGIIIRQIAKQYQRPTYIFEGDVIYTELNYFCIFLLSNYNNSLFMPYTIEWDDHSGIAHIVMVETNDSQPQNTYIYTGKYEKSARKIR